MNGQNTGAWSEVIRYCGTGAYPVDQPAPRSRGAAGRPQPREQLALRGLRLRGDALRQGLAVVGEELTDGTATIAALLGERGPAHRALRDILRPTPRGTAAATNPESAARSSRCGVNPARRTEVSS